MLRLAPLTVFDGAYSITDMLYKRCRKSLKIKCRKKGRTPVKRGVPRMSADKMAKSKGSGQDQMHANFLAIMLPYIHAGRILRRRQPTRGVHKGEPYTTVQDPDPARARDSRT